MSLNDKNVIVTGGGSGIGLAIARSLAREGCHVAIAGRRENQLNAAVQSQPSVPPIQCHRVDVADRASVQQLFNWARESLGPIDILVHSAGINIKNRSLAEMAPAEWDEVMATNATGAYNCLHAVLPDMRQRGDGLIVNINSVAGLRAAPLGGIAYNASKFAMTALGISAGNEEAEHGIRITNIYPGEVNTPILDHRPQPVSEAHKQAILQPEDIAALVVTIAKLPARAHVPELVIKPIGQAYF